MPKIKALQKGKVFRYNINRKRVDNKIRSVGTIQCPEIRKAWNDRRTLTGNLHDMGIAKDVSQVFHIPTAKEQRLKVVKKSHGFVESDLVREEREAAATLTTSLSSGSKRARSKKHVVEELEADANALRESGFRLPKGVVTNAIYMLEKYGLNYGAMVRDPKNYDQETWRSFRSRIRKFMSIPEQFGAYLVQSKVDIEALDLDEYGTDDE